MEDCCEERGEMTECETAGRCPECGREGRPVPVITLKALLRPGALVRLQPSDYRFCPDPVCQVAYFAAGSVYHKDDLEVRVGLKEKSDPVPVCYCFGHTRRTIEDEIRRTGSSTVAASVTAHIKAGRCGCEVNNPSGSCCLGDINREVKDALERIAAPATPDVPRARGIRPASVRKGSCS